MSVELLAGIVVAVLIPLLLVIWMPRLRERFRTFTEERQLREDIWAVTRSVEPAPDDWPTWDWPKR